jgi:phage terminase small subunit
LNTLLKNIGKIEEKILSDFMENQQKNNKLTAKEQLFCCEYIIDWNGTRAYRKAYPNCKSDKTAASEACKFIRKPKIQEYIKKIKDDIETQAGISKLLLINELKGLALSSINDTNSNWFTLEEFESLSPEIKKTIKETKHEKQTHGTGKDKYEVEVITIKKFDKLKAIEIMNKMMAYNKEKDGEVAPVELNITFGKDRK